METHEILYFLALARALSFTKAAAACDITQPALTRAIKKLETELGSALFHRGPGQISLTRLGEALVPKLEAIERGMADVRADAGRVAAQTSNALHLGVMCTVGPTHVASLLRQLRKKLPRLEIFVVDAKAADITALLMSHEIDVGITAWPTFPEGIVAEPLLSERYQVAFSADHALANHASVRMEDLAGAVYLERLSCEFEAYFAARHGDWAIDLDICFSSEREDWIQALLQAGMGCAVVPEFMDMAPGILKRPLVDPEVSRDIKAITLANAALPPAALQFLELVRQHRWAG
jgi:DNA-binding transcriptional LysR family regulator